MGSVIDLHVHTRVGSLDSRIAEAELTGAAWADRGLHGMALTEHESTWPAEKFTGLTRSVFAVNAREYMSEYGHVLVIGVPQADLMRVRGIAQLREATLARGGLMVIAHPFRHYPSSWNLLYPRSQDWWKERELAEWPPERLAEHPVFRFVDAVETLNGGSLTRQNMLARQVADVLGMPTVGASDAHDLTNVGRWATEFEDVIDSEASLIAAVRHGHCRPVERGSDWRYVAQPPGHHYADAGAAAAH
jgi:predicted metal-dependent phosphoesterase TrpH